MRKQVGRVTPADVSEQKGSRPEIVECGEMALSQSNPEMSMLKPEQGYHASTKTSEKQGV